MQKLIYRGSWPECMAGYTNGTAMVLDESGSYSRHSHFVQALRRYIGEDYIVFSRKQTCYVMEAK